MNLKEYTSPEQAIDVRTEACRLAAQITGPEKLDEHGTGRLMALCIFFESYIAHGAEWTNEHMKLIDDGEVVALRVISGGKS